MQEGYEDYYGINGCCLTCLNGYEGCLCIDCKCKKCFWYAKTWYGGVCDKKWTKEKAKEYYEQKQRLSNEEFRKKKKERAKDDLKNREYNKANTIKPNEWGIEKGDG